MDNNQLHQDFIQMGEYLVERDVLNVVDAIRNYDPNLRVKYLNRADSLGDAPYAITEICRDGVERLVFYVWKLDQTVIDRIYMADNSKHGVFDRMESHNASVRKEVERKFKESIAEGGDITKHIVASPKGRYTFKNEAGELITVDDDKKPSWKIDGANADGSI